MSMTKEITEAMCMAKFSFQVFTGRVFTMIINNKGLKKEQWWGKCLGLPLTGYGPVVTIFDKNNC